MASSRFAVDTYGVAVCVNAYCFLVHETCVLSAMDAGEVHRVAGKVASASGVALDEVCILMACVEA